MKSFHNILQTILLCAATLLYTSFSVNAQQDSISAIKKYLPSGMHVQYAGNIGMISAGPSWHIFSKTLRLDYSLGYVPKFDASKPIYTTALKAIYTPSLLDFRIRKIMIKPLSVGLGLSYTFGNRFNKYYDRSQYGKGYYWWGTAIRSGIFYQAEAYIPLKNKHIKGIGLYFESSLWDLDLYSYFNNSNYSYLSFWDIIILGAGTRIYF